MKAAALRHALTDRARNARIHVVTGVVDGETPPPRPRSPCSARSASARTCSWSSTATTRPRLLSARNLPQVHILEPGQLNTYDVLVSDDVVFTQAAFESFVSGPKAADTEGSEA